MRKIKTVRRKNLLLEVRGATVTAATAAQVPEHKCRVTLWSKLLRYAQQKSVQSTRDRHAYTDSVESSLKQRSHIRSRAGKNSRSRQQF